MLFEGQCKAIANRYFKKSARCFLKEGAAADVIVVDYNPLTQLDATNINGHMLFGMTGSIVETTVCNGRVLMKDRDSNCRRSKLWQNAVRLQKNCADAING